MWIPWKQAASIRPTSFASRPKRGLTVMRAVCFWMVTMLALLNVCTSASADQADEGRTYFMRYCASCHGVEADGKVCGACPDAMTT